jgi:hypothetical protein
MNVNDPTGTPGLTSIWVFIYSVIWLVCIYIYIYLYILVLLYWKYLIFGVMSLFPPPSPHFSCRKSGQRSQAARSLETRWVGSWRLMRASNVGWMGYGHPSHNGNPYDEWWIWYPMISLFMEWLYACLAKLPAMGTLWGLWKPSGWPPAFWFEMLQWGSRDVVAPVEFWPTVLASSCLMCSGQGRIRSNICNVD